MLTSTPETLRLLLLTVLFLFWLIELARIAQPVAPRKPSEPGPRPFATPHGRRLSRFACRQATNAPVPAPGAKQAVIPYARLKSSRGPLREKTTDTAGYACPHPDGRYYNNHDPQVHALVGYGHHGRRNPIQDFYCQACHRTLALAGSAREFTMRRHTPLYRLKTLPATVAQVLHAVAEGLSPRAAARVFELPEATVRTWLTRAGLHSHALHDQLFRGLHLAHVQLDELRLKLRGAAAAAWLWVACDARTKLILAFALGPRTQTLANQLAHELVRRLAPGELPVFSSDGMALYFYSLTAHFGHWLPATRERLRHWVVEERLLYAQVVKHCTCPNCGAGAGRHHRLARGTARLPRPAGSLPSLSVRSRPLGPDPDGVH